MKPAKCILASLLTVMCSVSYAQNPRAEIEQNKHFSAANFLAYPAPETTNLTKAPKGYKPFYISTYARHGSRYHVLPEEYAQPINILLKADSAGVLTQTGKEILGKMCQIQQQSNGRLGELTPLGARQHRGIAERMYRNFPEIFSKAIDVDARSTIAIRCILSMESECQRLLSLNPKLSITNDASYYDMGYMNYYDGEAMALSQRVRDQRLTEYKKKHIRPQRFMSVLFNDTTYLHNVGVDAQYLMDKIFFIAINMQSHDEKDLDFLDVFTPDECYDLWSCQNVRWYLIAGDTPLTNHRMPYIEANLLQNILDTADTCVVRKEPCATMRFGHESCLLPLAVLMELGDCGYVTDDLEAIADHWQCQRYFPMASNLQLVFYRKSGSDDVLVRALLNEKEMTMPVNSDCAPFYHWKDVEKYYRDKLAKWHN